MDDAAHERNLGRREFFGWATRRGLGVGLAATSLPALIQACSRSTDEPTVGASPSAGGAAGEGRALVGDVVDFSLTSDEWEGAFGSVTFRLHKATFDGKDAFFIRTDASDEAFAKSEKLVFVPKMAGLIRLGLIGEAFLVSGGPAGQGTVLSSVPGRPDYTPAWRLHRVKWTGTPKLLSSVRDVEAAKAARTVTVEDTSIVMNGMVVKWADGEMPVDTERKEYLGPGQLLEPPDTSAMTVTFKLHECFPEARYIVTDVTMAPMAPGMNILHSPKLERATEAGATAHNNVFMNGVDGPGPMKAQPSVFDSKAGETKWSPYWDHFTWGWKNGRTPRVLKTDQEVLAAESAGELDKFPGTPETKGKLFVVNCPVPVTAPNTFKA